MKATLIKNGTVYTPEHLGEQDVFMVGSSIVKIEKGLELSGCFLDAEVIDASGKMVVPGLIDQHVHLIGGGGEMGFASRTPEIVLSAIIRAGVTTVVGLLGTDGTARHIESLYAKAKGLEQEGITAFIHTGSYSVPSTTITGSITRDIMFIDKVIGVKVALSDHRDSNCTIDELARMASEARVAGMLSGKPGMVHIHMGRGKDKLDMIMKIVDKTEIPIKQFVPTHVTRTRELFEQAKQFAKMGGRIDITSFSELNPNGHLKPSEALAECIKEGVPAGNVTVSSDGNASIPAYDSEGNMVGMGVGKLEASHSVLKNLVKNEGVKIALALPFFTPNVPAVLDLYPKKGCLRENSDADIVIMDQEMNIDTVFAMGRKMMEHGRVIVKGTFE